MVHHEPHPRMGLDTLTLEWLERPVNVLVKTRKQLTGRG